MKITSDTPLKCINNPEWTGYYTRDDENWKSLHPSKRNAINESSNWFICLFTHKLSIILIFLSLLSGGVVSAQTQVTVTGAGGTAAPANGIYHFTSTTNIDGSDRKYFDMPSSVFRIEYRYNSVYGVNEWEIWESTARGGGGTVRQYNSSSSVVIPSGLWPAEVGAGAATISYTITPAPTVTGISPSSGPTAGGTSVVITGTALTGATAVNFGATAASGYTVNSATQITATSPAGSTGTVHITATTAGGTSATNSADQFTYVAAPTVTGISPTSGPTAGGTSVVITGTNLTGATAVKFSSTSASSYTVNSATQITATSPAGSAGTVHITVTTAGGTSATVSADQYTYVAAPNITGISPTGGPIAGGTSVVITGTNLTGATAVSFGGSAASGFTVNSATQITATSPAHSAGTIDITVTTTGGTSATGSADQFTYAAVPTISGISPTSGQTTGGTSVVITGTNFTGATAVSFGGTAASSYTVNSATQITATSPAHSAGTIDITVTTPGGTSATSSADQFTYYAAPTATTNVATGVSRTAATLNSSINANNASTSVTFEYGLTDSYGTSVAATPSPVTGSVNTSVSKAISGLTPNTTYHYRVVGVNSAGTTNGLDGTFTTQFATSSTFQTAGNWSDAGNWSAGVPGYSTNVNLSANCTIDVDCEVNNITINSGTEVTINASRTLTVNGDVTLKSDASNTASLLINGAITVLGTTNAERFMTGNKWHIVSPTAAGGNISAFIQAAGNAIPINGSSYGMMDYNESGNSWNSFFTSGTAGNLISCKGYCVRRSSDGVVTFTGTLTSGPQNVTLTSGAVNKGWNCVGNPYSTCIGINTLASSSANFITQNSSLLDPSYACVYLWEESSSSYKIINNTAGGSGRYLAQYYIVQGQGFFVKAASDGAVISFNSDTQVHQTGTALKSANVSWPGFELTLTAGQIKASTLVFFNNQMTKGLDPTYDAGLLRGTSGVNLFSRLVDDNGVDFAIQCLPETYNSLVIPIGIESKAGGEITFSVEKVELPTDCKVILEDKSTETFTSLSNGATYKTNVANETKGIGRFYIHTSTLTTGISSAFTDNEFKLKTYVSNSEIIIEGEVGNHAQASLFDVNGRKLGEYKLPGINRNSISTSGLASGVYFLNVTDAEKRFTSKIVIY